MSTFAQLDENNVVINVIKIPDVVDEQEGIDFCNKLIPGYNWKETCLYTRAGKHYFDKKPLRMNYAQIGYTYDPVRDAFIPPKPHADWKLIESTCQWEAPIEHRGDKSFSWDIDKKKMVEVTPVITLP